MMSLFQAIGANVGIFIFIVVALIVLYFVEKDRVKSAKEADAIDARLEAIKNDYTRDR